MIQIVKVNNKVVINKPKYFHCFKLSDTYYALFDIKMDMPLVVGSLSIITTTLLPPNSTIFEYHLNSKLFFEKTAKKTIEIKGEGQRNKPPLRYNYIDKDNIYYYHFKLTDILSVIFDGRFDKPLMYGSNQKIQLILNSIPKNSTIFYYKEDLSVKNSFKLFMTYEGKEI